jgi:hypothetical protein
MRWPARAAIRPVPAHAVVPQRAIDQAEDHFTAADDLEERVDRAFHELDERQPALARYIVQQIDQVSDETAQALGHFLAVAVHEAFVAAFGERIGAVDEGALELARTSFEVDEDLRRSSPDEALESDDVVAIAQPHLVSFVREQIDAALEPDEDGDPADVDLDAVSQIYRAILVEIMALSGAVAPPAGGVVRTPLLA